MEQPKKNSRFKSGCLSIGGGVLTLIGLLFVVIGAITTYSCIYGVEKRQAQSDAEWAEYVADSAHTNSQYRKFLQLQDEAYERNDTTAAMAYADSLYQYQEPEIFHGGENIGAALGIFVIIIGLVPLAIGIVMLIYFFASRKV